MTSGAEADWVGFGPDTEAIEPLTTEAFVQRLTRLSILARRLRQLRRAMKREAGRPQDLLDIDQLEAIQRRILAD
jgi:hypothetical protein